MRNERKRPRPKEGTGAGYCVICQRETSNGTGVVTKTGLNLGVICPNCMINSNDPRAQEARLQAWRV